MEDDLKALKKGQTPSGVELQKLPEKPAPTSLTPPPAPLPPQPVKPVMRVELGKTEAAKPLEVPRPRPTVPLPPPPKPAVSLSPSQLQVPQSGSKLPSKKLIFSLAILLVLLVGGYFAYVLLIKNPAASPTPTVAVITPTLTPTPTPANPIDLIFGANLSSITVATSGDPYASLKTAISAQNVDIGRLLFYKLSDDTGNRYSFPALLVRFVISHPAGLNQLDPNSQLLVSLYGAVSGSKNIGLVVPVSSVADARAAMSEWEKTMAKDLASLLGLNLKKQAAKTFSDNTYHDLPVRYLNFPNPDSTIDYAFVAAPASGNNMTFLVIANSRNHLYSMIDQILGF